MAIYYVDPNWTGTKSGTFAQPYDRYSGLPVLSAGDRVLLKEGTTHPGAYTAAQSGVSGNPIIFGVYRAADGAEVTTTLGAAAIAGTGTAADNFNTGSQSYIWLRCIEAKVVTAGRVGITLGSNVANTSGCRASYCRVNDQPSATAGVQARTNPGTDPHIVEFCESLRNAYGILVQGGTSGAAINLHDNVCQYNVEAGIRMALSTAGLVTGSVKNNDCRFNGVTQASEGHGVGIDNVSDSSALVISGNNCSDNYAIGIRGSCFSGLINAAVIDRNTCDRNGTFGIQISRGAGWKIRRNKCRYNGADRGNRYGRGIEIYSSSGSFPAGPGLVAGNDCSYNQNFGGTLNNGTEGVGIGLDDNHSGVLVFGNTCVGNEGNGIQFNPAGATGSSVVAGNLLVDNYNAPSSRVTAGWTANSRAQIALFSSEANAKVRNNTCVLTKSDSACLYGISEATSAAGAGVEVSNNLLVGFSAGIKARTGITRQNNAYWNCRKAGESNADTTTLSDDTGALLLDPRIDSTYRPLESSPLRGAGAYVGDLLDNSGKRFRNPPCVGAFEYLKPRRVSCNDSDPWAGRRA